ncbi:SMEK domain-containing protein [Pseudomonas sp. P66]|uniref:SMEK domain-containing protein n=1 Tax=Pseudomonas arcuscaelestis TaxID=2710591 RepID=A0ABS2BYG4_9PSED|nr:SMEK domain-containing protein [Pseudomonas arcuscaelestis]MBM5458654.1 SMEK domain-containing protein [Pseudomonas arcuscaelestis]
MITRGHLIGQIIDEFVAVGEQAKLRSSLTLNDLPVYCENFFRDVINITEGWNLVNLNEKRQNEPGLDLSDEAKKVAVQVTNTRTSEKINHTLQKITEDQAKKHKRFIVFVIGGRQKTYDAVNSELAEKYSFDIAEDIWDTHTIAKKAVSLPIERLQSLHELVRKEMARVKVELQIPNEDGEYATSGYTQWEPILKPKAGSGNHFNDWLIADRITPADPQHLQASLALFASQLAALPRITREFLVMLYERCDPDRNGRFRTCPALVLPKVQRTYLGDDLQGELDILVDAGLVALALPEDESDRDSPAEIGLIVPGKCPELKSDFHRYVVEKGLSFRTVVGGLDLSGF